MSRDADLSLSYIWTKTCFAYFHNGIINMVLLIGMLLFIEKRGANHISYYEIREIEGCDGRRGKESNLSFLFLNQEDNFIICEPREQKINRY